MFPAGFNGAIATEIQKSNETNINLAEIKGDSTIEIKNSNEIPVKISVARNIVDNCDIFVKSDLFNNFIGDFQLSEESNDVTIIKTNCNINDKKTNLFIFCPKSEVHLTELSWSENFLLNKMK